MNTAIKTYKGFSLIEALICLLILGLAGYWMLLTVNDQSENLKMKRAAAQVHLAFIAAREAAYSKKQDVWLHILVTSSETFIAIHADASVRAKNTIFSNAINPQTLSDVYLSSTTQVLRFSGVTGRPSGNGNISFWLSSESKIKLIYHDISGRIRICADGILTYGYVRC